MLKKFLLSLFVIASVSVEAVGQSKSARPCDELGISAMHHLVTVKARFQQRPQTAQEQRILKMGKRAIPLLIDCLTDETPTREPAFDFWPSTKVQVVAFTLLGELFSDSRGHSTLLEVVTWKDVYAESKDLPEWDAWDAYLRKHGSSEIQRSWSANWSANKRNIYWDSKQDCFRVRTSLH